MLKDWQVWAGCLLLFLTGGVYFNMLPQVTFKAASLADFIGGLSAVAAATAAWASWNAANIAKQSAEDNKVFARAQLYISHRGDFDDLLDYVAKELGVIFYRKNELYKKLFPQNHYSGEVFDSKGDSDVFKQWRSKYRSIVVRSETPLSDEGLYEWISDCMELLRDIHYEHAKPDEAQICFWAFTEHPEPTGFTSSPARHVFNLAEVMNRIFTFSGREEIETCFLEGHPFESHYNLYYEKIRSGHEDHFVGVPGEPMTPMENS